MATLTKAINQSFFDSILPKYGNPRVHIPVWDTGQRMFIFDEWESDQGNRHYRGIRFCEQIVILEKVGLYHNWTYIDSIELYAFNGVKIELIQKRDYEKTFRSVEFIRQESVTMVRDFIEGVIKTQGSSMVKDEIETQAKNIVEGCYKSFLDSDFNTRLTRILPQIEQK